VLFLEEGAISQQGVLPLQSSHAVIQPTAATTNIALAGCGRESDAKNGAAPGRGWDMQAQQDASDCPLRHSGIPAVAPTARRRQAIARIGLSKRRPDRGKSDKVGTGLKAQVRTAMLDAPESEAALAGAVELARDDAGLSDRMAIASTHAVRQACQS
jgi:hypothetical protein